MDTKHSRKQRGADAVAEINKGLRKLSGIMDIPPSAISGVPQIELGGNREAVVDGCQGILEYSEDSIKLAAGKLNMRFAGRELQLKVLTHDSAVIEGYITSIEFLE
jgi:sporulation protein YqfC